MLFVTRWFGVTGSDAERDPVREKSVIEEIVQKSLLLQKISADKQRRSLARGTHAKGVCVRAQFEVFDVSSGRDRELAERLAKGLFEAPGVYPAVVRFGNSDPRKNSDFKADVRSMSFSVDLNRGDFPVKGAGAGRQDYSLQNTRTLPINDAAGFLPLAKVLTASSPGAALWALPLKDKLRILRTGLLVQFQLHQEIKPYQQMRYGSNVPFRHGPVDVVKFFATPCTTNPATSLQRHNPNGLQDELIRHVEEDSVMSSFDFGVQFLDPDKMTYWGKRHDANFWIENASIDWKESEAPFHTIARITLLPVSHLPAGASDEVYFDVTGNSTVDSTPVGSINRARWPSEVASRKARMQSAEESGQPSQFASENAATEEEAYGGRRI